MLFIKITDINYCISAETVLQQGGESFKKRIKAERIALGISEDDSAVFALQQRNRSAIASVNDLQMGSHSINGTIHESEAAAPGVIVRLELILPEDSLYSNNVEEVDSLKRENKITIRKVYAVDSLRHSQLQSLIAYTQTDINGDFSFKNLPDNKTYQVLPLQLNYAFGLPQGVEKLDKDANFNFNRSPHRLKLFFDERL